MNYQPPDYTWSSTPRAVPVDVGAVLMETYFRAHRANWPPFVVELNERGYFVPRPVSS